MLSYCLIKIPFYVLNQLLISLRSFSSQFSELIAYQKSTIIDDIIRRHRESRGLQILGSDFTVTVAAGFGPGTKNIFRNMLGVSEVMLFLLFRSYHLGTPRPIYLLIFCLYFCVYEFLKGWIKPSIGFYLFPSISLLLFLFENNFSSTLATRPNW